MKASQKFIRQPPHSILAFPHNQLAPIGNGTHVSPCSAAGRRRSSGLHRSRNLLEGRHRIDRHPGDTQDGHRADSQQELELFQFLAELCELSELRIVDDRHAQTG